MSNDNLDTPLGRYVTVKHCYKDTLVQFFALEHVHPSPREGNLDQLWLQKECRWIF